MVIWRVKWVFFNIGRSMKNLRPAMKYFFRLRNSSFEVHSMITNCVANEGFEISPRFRRTVEERIARLERDAEFDEAQVLVLDDVDHIRRQMRLVAVERSEALRMRIFLDRARTRLPRPLIAL
jgi:hypothetical protein